MWPDSATQLPVGEAPQPKHSDARCKSQIEGKRVCPISERMSTWVLILVHCVCFWWKHTGNKQNIVQMTQDFIWGVGKTYKFESNQHQKSFFSNSWIVNVSIILTTPCCMMTLVQQNDTIFQFVWDTMWHNIENTILALLHRTRNYMIFSLHLRKQSLESGPYNSQSSRTEQQTRFF